MIRNSTVTVYHQAGDGYVRHFFPRVSLHHKNGIQTGESGHAAKNSLIVRVFTQEELLLQPGDILVIGYSESLLPPTENFYTVRELVDNRRGSGKMQHYKLVAA